MTDLTSEHCEACRADASKLTDNEIESLRSNIPQWTVFEADQIQRLTRQYKFDNFLRALEFTNKIGELAETEDHHPAILTEWGSVKITWWTHKIGGLHRNDFIMASKTDILFVEK